MFMILPQVLALINDSKPIFIHLGRKLKNVETGIKNLLLNAPQFVLAGVCGVRRRSKYLR